MGEQIIQITEGTGKKLHTFDRTIGANTVNDEVVLLGHPYEAVYSINAVGISLGTVGQHILQIMAGASLRVYLQRLIVYQQVAATTAALIQFRLARLSTAGTGGGAQTSIGWDPADAAAGASASSAITTPGTVSGYFAIPWGYAIQTVTASLAPGVLPVLLDLDFEHSPQIKPPIIAAGTSNGFALLNQTGAAGAQVSIYAKWTEANF